MVTKVLSIDLNFKFLSPNYSQEIRVLFKCYLSQVLNSGADLDSGQFSKSSSGCTTISSGSNDMPSMNHSQTSDDSNMRKIRFDKVSIVIDLEYTVFLFLKFSVFGIATFNYRDLKISLL